MSLFNALLQGGAGLSVLREARSCFIKALSECLFGPDNIDKVYKRNDRPEYDVDNQMLANIIYNKIKKAAHFLSGKQKSDPQPGRLGLSRKARQREWRQIKLIAFPAGKPGGYFTQYRRKFEAVTAQPADQ